MTPAVSTQHEPPAYLVIRNALVWGTDAPRDLVIRDGRYVDPGVTATADAPEIDGCVFLNGVEGFEPGDMIRVKVTNSDEYDLWAKPVPAED